jgi:biopolymer transport protein ExbD
MMVRANKPTLIPGRRYTAGNPSAKLQLTSLVDMMVILVVFLLKSFSADGQLISPASGMELPSSTCQNPVTSGLIVEVGPEQVFVAGNLVLPTASLVGADKTSMEILTQALQDSGNSSSDTPVLIQSDKRIEYSSLGKVLSACSLAGYSDISLVVLGDES